MWLKKFHLNIKKYSVCGRSWILVIWVVMSMITCWMGDSFNLPNWLWAVVL